MDEAGIVPTELTAVRLKLTSPEPWSHQAGTWILESKSLLNCRFGLDRGWRTVEKPSFEKIVLAQD